MATIRVQVVTLPPATPLSSKSSCCRSASRRSSVPYLKESSCKPSASGGSSCCCLVKDGSGVADVYGSRENNVKILLVEDSKPIQRENEGALTKAGYEVLCAEDGQSAIQMAQEKNPDLILLDMILPKLSGPEVLRRLKSDARTAKIPVVVLSSLS